MSGMTSPEEPIVTPVGDKPRRPRKPARAEKRPVLVRLFGITVWGGVKLAVTCILVGFFLLALEFDPVADDVDVFAALSELVRNLAGAAVWAVKNFWQPLLAGGSIVLPLWVLWRLASLPFRK
ncbi:hypothetical protein [Henriciella aquimarina]|uniref:hypothetical protein n=1 Tax=Henriciella aquimarina TaxID=545261 RepID=UPI000A065602|nr:hypothetical protein [Henriciella aquimarina]